MDILRRFYACDECCREFLPQLQAHQLVQGQGPRQQEATLRVSAVRTSRMLFQTSGFRNFQTFSLPQVCASLLPGLFPTA